MTGSVPCRSGRDLHPYRKLPGYGMQPSACSESSGSRVCEMRPRRARRATAVLPNRIVSGSCQRANKKAFAAGRPAKLDAVCNGSRLSPA